MFGLTTGKSRARVAVALIALAFAAKALLTSTSVSAEKKESGATVLKGEVAPRIVDEEERPAAAPSPDPAPSAAPVPVPVPSAPAPSSPRRSEPSPKPRPKPEPELESSREIPPVPKARPYSLSEARKTLERAKTKAGAEKYDDAFELATEIISSIEGCELASSGADAAQYRSILDEAQEVARDAGDRVRCSADGSGPFIFIY